MKNMINTIFSLALALSLTAQDAVETLVNQESSSSLTVEVIGLDSDQGQLMVALYDSAGNWLKKEMLGEISLIEAGKATVVFNNVPYGEYGISTFHDENNNGELDAGLFGIPKEPYASSRGAKGMFGPPKWTDAIFEVNAATTTETIKY